MKPKSKIYTEIYGDMKTNLKYRQLYDYQVFPMAIGCMGLAEFYGEINPYQSALTIKSALDAGIQLIDTADMYGQGLSERLVAEATRGMNRESYIISTKVGFVRNSDDVMQMSLNGNPNYIKKSCDESLKRLQTDYIDLYFLHRVDPNCPIEDSIGAMKDLIDMGKVRCIGLSDTTFENINKAMSVHTITAYQAEYSLLHRYPEQDGTLDFCRKHGITFMPYCPLGRGLLAEEIIVLKH
jgi:aryl-alcohol dehydrogenase-like predicted oxidoreductase